MPADGLAASDQRASKGPLQTASVDTTQKSASSGSPTAERAAKVSNHVRAIHVAGDDQSVRLVLDMEKSVGFKTRHVKDPARFILDLSSTDFAIDGNTARGEPGFLKKLRYGRLNAGVSRLIIEANGPFLVQQTFAVPSKDGKQIRLVIDFKTVNADTFETAIARQAELERKSLLAEERKKQTVAKTAKGDSAATKPRRKTIVIDPGHGGIDGGATGKGGAREKDVVLKFAKTLAHALSAGGKFDVRLTRDDDVFVSLSKRVRFARDKKADLFVSIHADSFPQDRTVRGATVYTLSDRASNAMAAAIARQENKADLIAGYSVDEAPSDVVNILLDLTRRETTNLSLLFAKHVIREMKPKIRFFKRPHQTGAFTVLKVPDIPSALIELGYLSNASDEEQLTSPEWRERTALQIASTISSYFNTTASGQR
ncbi:MAG: N-acetylmuramoyl-L-alanine amidase [Pseudomonadota bacterium]